jgi:hypothetical protein
LFFEERPMGMEGVRIAFLHAAAGGLRLDHAGLSYRDGAQVLAFTGWHADGTPFALVTAPFCGDVQLRARQAVRDIVAAHSGAAQAAAPQGADAATSMQSTRREVTMSQKGSGLARLMGGLKNLDAGADALAGRLETALAAMAAEMATTSQIVGNVEQSLADLQAVNRLYSNGGPPLPSSAASSAPSGT